MHSEQETRETVLMNLLLANSELTPEDIKSGMVFAGVLEPTEENLNNFIRAIIISINRRFTELGIQFVRNSRIAGTRFYSITPEAKKFAESYLLETLYDEEGKICGSIYQHPISLKKERMELV